MVYYSAGLLYNCSSNLIKTPLFKKNAGTDSEPPEGHRLTMKRRYAIFLALTLFAAAIPPARAHAPHDVIKMVEVSPDFPTDQTVFAVTLLSDHLLFARSLDGGKSWSIYASPVIGHTITRLAFSPGFAMDGILFASTRHGGIWRSTDFGLSWQAVNTGLSTLIVYDLSVSPEFPIDQTVLAATADGLFRSTDSGDTWTHVNDGFVETSLTVVRFAPGNGSAAFAGEKTIHRSDDGGLTWAPLESFTYKLKVLDISPNFQSDDTMAVLLEVPVGVYGSVDAGVTWTASNTDLTDLHTNDIAIADDGTLFVVTKDDGCFRADALFSSWTLFDEGFEMLSDQTTNHFRSVAVSPEFSLDGTVIVGAFEGLFKSVDRGETFRQSDVYNSRLCRRLNVPANYAQNGFLYAGNFGGGPFLWRGKPSSGSSGSPGSQFKTLENTGGGGGANKRSPGASQLLKVPTLNPPPEWDALGDPITSPYTSVCITSPNFAEDRLLFYAYQGLWRSVNSGISWSKLGIPVEIPREITFSPNFAIDRTLYMGTDAEGSFVSTDGGDSWAEMTGGLPHGILTKCIRLSPMFPDDPLVFISTVDQGVWRSLDAGATWTKKSNGLPDNDVRVLDISPDFTNDGLLIAGVVENGLFRSDDLGDTWTPINDDFPSGSDNVFEGIAFSPNFVEDRTVFAVSLYDGVFKSTDGGWNWYPAQSGLPRDAGRVIAISPNFAEDETLFLSTHAWLWQSRDGGASWNRLPGYNRVGNRHHTVFYEGDWRIRNHPESFAQKIAIGVVTGSTQELEFHGDKIVWFAFKDSESGIAEVILDGQSEALVDLYSPAPDGQQPVFTKTFGSVDWHTIKIRVTGTKNPLSSHVIIKSNGFAFTF